MMFREYFEIETKQGIDRVDITNKIKEIVSKCQIKEGLCHVYLLATTAGLTINENCPMLNQDFKEFFNLVDEKAFYHHPENAHSHLRANMTSTQKTIPLADGELILGTYQSIMVWEFDTKPRKRKIIITIDGQ